MRTMKVLFGAILMRGTLIAKVGEVVVEYY